MPSILGRQVGDRCASFASPLTALLALALVSLVGCGREPEIESYSIPAGNQAGTSGGNEIATLPRRMMGAILLRGNSAWFFKITGPPEQVEQQADAVRKFLTTLTLPEDRPNDVDWQLPEGWKKGPPHQMRHSTLLLPNQGEPLEVTITKLHYDGNETNALLSNIVRWRGQIGLAAVEKVDTDAGVEVIEVDGTKAWLFDAVGMQAAGGPSMGKMPPFAGSMGGNPAPSPHGASLPALSPHGFPPRAKLPTASVKFDLPSGWKKKPNGSLGSKNYTVGEGETLVKVNLSQFSPFGMMGDPLANFNRWRKQVGLGPLTQKQLLQETEAIQLGGVEGRVGVMASENGLPAMLAAMVNKFDQVWFFKVTGSKAAIEAHHDELMNWLQELRIVETNPTETKESQDESQGSNESQSSNKEK